MNPFFPSFLYPVQTCNEYGSTPHAIPLFQSTGTGAVNTSFLWLLCGLLSRVQELWAIVYKIPLYQSKWNGWIQTYLANKMFHHYSQRAKPGDPFSMTYMRSIKDLSQKMVSSLYGLKPLCNIYIYVNLLNHLYITNRIILLEAIHLQTFFQLYLKFMSLTVTITICPRLIQDYMK